MVEVDHKNDVSDPTKFGPGMWYTIHITALKLGQDLFIDWIRITLNSIPCLKCRNHAIEYLDENNPTKFRDIYNSNGELIGMFQWTWKFHNDVNARLSKKIYDFDEIYRMYSSDSALCSDKCGSHQVQKEKSTLNN